MMRWYVAAVSVAAAATIGVAGAYTDWGLSDFVKFLLLAACAVISTASTPKIAYAHPGVIRDFSTVWVLPAAVLLPPVYAALETIPIYLTLQLYVHRGVVYRRDLHAHRRIVRHQPLPTHLPLPLLLLG